MASPQITLPPPREYQAEMYEASLRRNIIIAMPTGSGKTHVAVLRLKKEAERELKKVSWFIAPTVSLCEQQQDVIRRCLGLPVGLISGALQPDQWSNPRLWKDALSTHRIIVSTPQVLLDALHHGYVRLGSNVGLLIFDEAHHTNRKHPYNLIMRDFYDMCRPRDFACFKPSEEGVRPFVLGLTASPMFKGSVDKAFEKLEENLDAVIMAPQFSRSALESHVHTPTFKYIAYPSRTESDSLGVLSTNVRALHDVIRSMDIDEDPTVRALQQKLANVTNNASEFNRVDQRLSKAKVEKDTFVFKGMRDFYRTAKELCIDAGPWAADWYVASVIKKALRKGAQSLQELIPNSRPEETACFVKLLRNVRLQEISYFPDDVVKGCSPKAKRFIDCLLMEKKLWEGKAMIFSGLVFITRRDGALALSALLTHHPRTKSHFSVGTLLGSSESNKRNSFIDISRSMLPQKHTDVLADFRSGDKNLVVATSVAEEGLDIPNCGTVIRWDPPSNMVSWLQSRGRARHKESSFVLMYEEESSTEAQIASWKSTENEMKRRYNEERLRFQQAFDEEKKRASSSGLNLEFRSLSGAKMTAQSVISHLAHFCNKLSALNRSDVLPIYDIDPPDYPIGYHAIVEKGADRPINMGPFNVTLILPRLLPPHLRIHRTQTLSETKDDARRLIAFKAYKALYEAGLLNENLLPFSESIRTLHENSVPVGFVNLMQKDPWQSILGSSEDPLQWYESHLEVEGVGSLRMFTRSSLRRSELSSIALHGPEHGQLCSATITPKESATFSASQLQDAQHFTRRLLSAFHGRHLGWENLDFTYLFLPSGSCEDTWEERRTWADTERLAGEQPDALGRISTNMASFGAHFGYPTDVHLLVDRWSFFEFREWRTSSLTKVEEETVRTRYRNMEGLEIDYPVVMARPIKHRNNFLVSSTEDTSIPDSVLLLPSQCQVILDSRMNITFSLLLPSILRAVFMRITALSLKTELLDRAPSLTTIPIDLVQRALMTPGADTYSNYERLETLGDAVLKLIVTVHLHATRPHWPEGFLFDRRKRAVSNATLAEAGKKSHLYQWIMRTPFSGRRWIPDYRQATDVENVHLAQFRSMVDGVGDEEARCEEQNVNLSTKVLADVVESLIGASFLSGGFDRSIDCMNVLGLTIDGPWQPLSQSISEVSERSQARTLTLLEHAENIIGYSFKNKGLLLEALMHANCLGDIESMSYERLQLVGDAVLDFVVVESLYRDEAKQFSPAEMHSRKIAIVNSHFLAFICLRAHGRMETAMPTWDQTKRTATPSKQEQQVGLYQCLLHTTSRLFDEQHRVVARFQHSHDAIEAALEHGSSYPWAALARVSAPKWFGDIIESLIGAVYFDSGGDLDTVRNVLSVLGVTRLLYRLQRENVDLTHPVTRVMEWAGKHQLLANLRFMTSKKNEKITCSLTIDDKQVVSSSGCYDDETSEDALKIQVADDAFSILLREYQ